MMAPRSPCRPPRHGSVLVWLLLGMTVIVGVVALGMDGGRMLDERRHAQTAADAAALAAAADLYQNYWTQYGKDTGGTSRTAALNSAQANGYANDGTQSTVTVNVPPQSGAYAGQAGYVEVVVRGFLPAGFGRIFTGNALTVQARAVAAGRPAPIGLIVLRKSGANALLNNAAALTVVNSPVLVNSTDPAAYTQNAPGVVLASRFGITGNYVNPGGALILGPVRTGTSPVPDPLAFLPVPDTKAAPVRSAVPLVINSLLPTVLQPGVYKGGILIKGLSSVVMQPGVYVMDGGGFQVTGTATVAGLGVMIYNTAGSFPAGSIQVNSLAKVVLSAPLSGTYQGVNFFQDRTLAQPVSMTGFGLTTVTGVVYAAAAPVNLTGSAAAGVDILGGSYVCDSMQVSGLGGINIDLGLNPPRVPEVHVVE